MPASRELLKRGSWHYSKPVREERGWIAQNTHDSAGVGTALAGAMTEKAERGWMSDEERVSGRAGAGKMIELPHDLSRN